MRNRGRTRLRFQKPIPGNDGFGPNPAAGGWGEDLEVGVNLRPLRGTQALDAAVVSSTQIYECEVRSHYCQLPDGISTTWRAVDVVTGSEFNVIAVAQRDDDYRWTRVTIVRGEIP